MVVAAIATRLPEKKGEKRERRRREEEDGSHVTVQLVKIDPSFNCHITIPFR